MKKSRKTLKVAMTRVAAQMIVADPMTVAARMIAAVPTTGPSLTTAN
jgi:hypothetical protein